MRVSWTDDVILWACVNKNPGVACSSITQGYNMLQQNSQTVVIVVSAKRECRDHSLVLQRLCSWNCCTAGVKLGLLSSSWHYHPNGSLPKRGANWSCDRLIATAYFLDLYHMSCHYGPLIWLKSGCVGLLDQLHRCDLMDLSDWNQLDFHTQTCHIVI